MFLLKLCVTFAMVSSFSNPGTADSGHVSFEEKLLSSFQFSFIGTKWCGPGNTAKNFDDLGHYVKTDTCCRGHDSCKDYIAPDETKNNLRNDDIVSRFSCVCDEEFFQCLKKANDDASYIVGTIYFNIFKAKCYKQNDEVWEWRTHREF